MGGTQRLAERAGPARARELVMTGALYDAATLERWNVVNRVLPDDGFDGGRAGLRARARRGADARPRGDQGDRPRAGRGRRAARPTRACPSWPATCSPPRTSRAPCARSWSRVPATRPTRAAERALAPACSGGRSRHDPAHARPPRASRRARRSLLAGCAAVLALAAAAPAAEHARARGGQGPQGRRRRRARPHARADRARLRPPRALRADPRRAVAAQGPARRARARPARCACACGR